MSFFMKKKRSNVSKENNAVTASKKFKDELTSESEYEDESNQNESENEEETAQEKRLRLAKEILKQYEAKENDDEDISMKLKHDFLKQTGKFKTFVADKYIAPDKDCLAILRCKEHKIALTCLCISSDNKFVFSGSKDGGIVKWSITERKKINSISYKKRNKDANNENVNINYITSIAVSDSFKYLVIGGKSKDIYILNPDNLTYINTLKGHKSDVMGLVFRKDSEVLYSCSQDHSVKVWSLSEMAYLETLFGHQDAIIAIDALSRERAITAGGVDKTVRLWKISEESQLIFNATDNITCVKFINEDNFVSGSEDGEVSIWSQMKKKPLCSVKHAHGCNPINNEPLWIISVTALVNSDLLASGASDGSIRLWKVSNSYRSISSLFTIPVCGFINCLSFTSDGTYLIVGVGQEHRCGRWSIIKEAKNGILFIPLNKND